MNLLSFLAIAIHPHTPGPNPLLRHPVSGAPPQQPQGLSGGWWLAPLAVALHPLPWHAAGCARGHQRLHLWALVQLWVSLQLLSVAALKIEQRIRSLQQFLLADAFNTSLATGFSRMQRYTEACGVQRGFLEVVHQLPECVRALAASPA